METSLALASEHEQNRLLGLGDLHFSAVCLSHPTKTERGPSLLLYNGSPSSCGPALRDFL